jgi:hypothetical protein
VFTSTDPTGGDSAWAPTSIPGAQPLAVACPSTSLCVTAGSLGEVAGSTDPTGGSGAWSVSPIDGSDALVDVSCPTLSFCAAIDDGGNALFSGDPISASARWITTRVVPPPPESQFGQAAQLRESPLQAISCAKPRLCVAVGQETVAATSSPSGRWSVSTLHEIGTLTSVSCPSVSLCVAVTDNGEVLSSTDPTGGEEAWRRTIVNRRIELGSVSCPSSRLCVAAGLDEGHDPPTSSNRGDLLTSTDPTGGPRAWTLVRPHGSTDVAAVACPSTRLCFAASDNGLLSSTRPAEGPRAWRLHPLQNSQDITGLTCPGRVLCVAVNLPGAISYGEPIQQRAWIPVTIGDYDLINGVSCPTTRACVAVGDDGIGVTGARGRRQRGSRGHIGGDPRN